MPSPERHSECRFASASLAFDAIALCDSFSFQNQFSDFAFGAQPHGGTPHEGALVHVYIGIGAVHTTDAFPNCLRMFLRFNYTEVYFCSFLVAQNNVKFVYTKGAKSMCYVVDAPCLIANAFYVNQSKTSLDLRALHRAARRISASIAKYNAIVSWTKNDLLYACNMYRDLFQQENDKLIKSSERGQIFNDEYVSSVFNHNLNPDIITAMQNILEEAA